MPIAPWVPPVVPMTRAKLLRLARPTRWHWWEGPSTWVDDMRFGRAFISHRRWNVELGGITHGAKVCRELRVPRAGVTSHRPHVPGFKQFFTWDQDHEPGRRFRTLRELLEAVVSYYRPDLNTKGA